MTQQELQKIKVETDEWRDRVHQRLRDSLEAVLKTPQGRHVWTWIQWELCDRTRPGKTAQQVADEMDAALIPYPDLHADLWDTLAKIRRDEAFYHAGMSRLREHKQTRSDHA